MSSLAAPLASFLFFSSFVAAQISAPDCSLTWAWTFNTLGQNACTVIAYLASTCNNGAFTVYPLQPGYTYPGPTGSDNSDLCKCNTVAYSLISACDACQGNPWIPWSQYSHNCTTTLPPSSFPNAVPSGTRVPHWALIDVTTEGNWNANKSYSVGDSPEAAPGAILGSSGSTTTASGSTATVPVSGNGGATLTTSPFSQPSSPTSSTSPTSKSGSNSGAIAGGVVGGIAAISLAVAAIVFFLRRRSEAPAVAPPVIEAFQPPMDEVQQPLRMDGGYAGSSIPTTGSPSIPGTIGSSSMSGAPLAPMRIYDPNDPTTFPGYQGVSPSPTTPPLGAGNSLATMQTSRQQGYHGLPTV